MPRNTNARAIHRSQGGQTILLFALMLPVLLGFTGLAVDYSRLLGERRNLQNAADAAVMSGVVNLVGVSTTDNTPPYSRAKACSDANSYLSQNGYSTSATCNSGPTFYMANCPPTGSASPPSITLCKTYANSDTIMVTVNQSVNVLFLRVLGVGSFNVAATAKAVDGGLQVGQCTISATGDGCFPYMVSISYGPGCTSIITSPPPGNVVLFHSNHWAEASGTDAEACWYTGGSSKDKGFLRDYCGNCGAPEPVNWDPTCATGCLSTGPNPNVNALSLPCSSPQTGCDTPNTAAPGNSCGQEKPFTDAMQIAFANHQPVWMPMFDYENGTGGLNFHILEYAEVRLDFTYPGSPSDSPSVDPYGAPYPHGDGAASQKGDYTCPNDMFGKILGFATSPPSGSTGNTLTACDLTNNPTLPCIVKLTQ